MIYEKFRNFINLFSRSIFRNVFLLASVGTGGVSFTARTSKYSQKNSAFAVSTPVAKLGKCHFIGKKASKVSLPITGRKKTAVRAV